MPDSDDEASAADNEPDEHGEQGEPSETGEPVAKEHFERPVDRFRRGAVGSVVAAGLDPANLSQGNPSAMNFNSGGNPFAKAWRDIWGCGQGIGAVKSARPVEELIVRLAREYEEAKEALAVKTARTNQDRVTVAA